MFTAKIFKKSSFNPVTFLVYNIRLTKILFLEIDLQVLKFVTICSTRSRNRNKLGMIVFVSTTTSNFFSGYILPT